jgi:hypothetical protein
MDFFRSRNDFWEVLQQLVAMLLKGYHICPEFIKMEPGTKYQAAGRFYGNGDSAKNLQLIFISVE